MARLNKKEKLLVDLITNYDINITDEIAKIVESQDFEYDDGFEIVLSERNKSIENPHGVTILSPIASTQEKQDTVVLSMYIDYDYQSGDGVEVIDNQVLLHAGYILALMLSGRDYK